MSLVLYLTCENIVYKFTQENEISMKDAAHSLANTLTLFNILFIPHLYNYSITWHLELTSFRQPTS